MLSLNLLLSREKIRLRDEKPELKRIILIEIREKKKSGASHMSRAIPSVELRRGTDRGHPPGSHSGII